MRKKNRIILSMILGLTLCYAVFFPVQTAPAANRYDFYIITDEQGLRELMRVRVNVYIGDEILTEDNKLYEIIRIEENHAYAKYQKQIKL